MNFVHENFAILFNTGELTKARFYRIFALRPKSVPYTRNLRILLNFVRKTVNQVTAGTLVDPL